MKNNSIEKDHRRENETHETNPSSVLEKHWNEENHSSSNPKHSVEEVTPTTSGTPETAAASLRVEKEVGSNTDSATNLNTTTTSTVGGER